MKNTFGFIILLFFAYCTSKNKVAPQTIHSHYMDSIIPFMNAFSLDTAIIFDWNGNKHAPKSHFKDRSITHIVGKFIDRTEIFALEYISKDTLINFYHFKSGDWKIISSHRAIGDDMTTLVEFIDMNNDGNNEIIVRTPPNMNGNTIQDVFHYSSENDTIEYAGSFFSCDYKINREKQTVEVTYEGSWYMPLIKTIYQWHNNKLVRIKEINLDIVDIEQINDERILRYYENTSYDKDSLKLIKEAPFKGEKSKKMWDFFFDEL